MDDQEIVAVTFLQYNWGIGGWNGPNKPDANLGTLLYLFQLSLPGAWAVGTSPTLTYNHNLPKGNRWNVPVGPQVAKTMLLGKLPVKFELAGYYSVKHEDLFGQRWQITLDVIPVIPSLVTTPLLGGVKPKPTRPPAFDSSEPLGHSSLGVVGRSAMINIGTVTVLGTGVLGSQIAYQIAYSGHEVVAYDVSDEALTAGKRRISGLAVTYKEQVKGAADGNADAALKRITWQTDLGNAVAEADLVIESIPEKIELKRDIFGKIRHLAPANTIFATNTSTLLPSALMESTVRPERFLSLHFASPTWSHNTAEVMGTSKTDSGVYQTIVAFASAIGMVPIELKKEHPEYVLNSLRALFEMQ